jgi:phosphoglycolate phosphatase
MTNEARSAVFDLDGTLVATPDAIAYQLVEAVHDVTGTRPRKDVARRLVGKPLEQLCGELVDNVHARSELTAAVVTNYQDRYRHFIVPGARDLLYEGVIEGLQTLRERGFILAVVTTKAQRSAEQLLTAAGIAPYFLSVVGADRVTRPKPDPAGILLALQDMRVSSAEQSTMVGDTRTDIEAARMARVEPIGVTYGVGHRHELISAGTTLVADDFPTVVQHLLTGNGA